jgi:hypothetical protein
MNIIEYKTNVGREDSKIGIVTRLLTAQLRNHLIAARGKRFSSYSKASKTDS